MVDVLEEGGCAVTVLDDIARLCEKATPGPWSGNSYEVIDARNRCVCECVEEADIAFIAALSPERVAVLIELARWANVRGSQPSSFLFQIIDRLREVGLIDGEET